MILWERRQPSPLNPLPHTRRPYGLGTRAGGEAIVPSPSPKGTPIRYIRLRMGQFYDP